jgi:predicted nucleotidyltransferase
MKMWFSVWLAVFTLLAFGSKVNAQQQALYSNDRSYPLTYDSFVTASIALGDLDGDGDIDIVVGNVGSVNEVYVNDGSGILSLNASFGSNASTYGLALGDVNGDGMIDIVTAESLAINRVFYQKLLR